MRLRTWTGGAHRSNKITWRRLKHEERDEQIKFINHLKENYPDILYCASAGGMRTHPRVAIQMKMMGYISGHPDVAIYEPCGVHHGLFIEMKRIKGGTVSPEQTEFIAKLIKRGYVAKVARGAEEAKQILKDYLGGIA